MMRKFLKDRRAASQLISSAALIPILLLILASIVNISVVSNMQTMVNEAAFEGARIGIKSDTPEQTAQMAVLNFGEGITGWKIGDRLSVITSLKNDMLTVEVRYTFYLLGGHQKTLVGRSSLRLGDTP
ncbi:TadE/TadG family type IV pilus assembly protein [Thermoanaerobacter uzonensis]|uniref:TadE/TadG family type IV pilus assembly protein n=1 Tax=Thermoanaerobacter uzonensis TaxID=447593 RepID=UPI003D7677D0